MKLKIVTGLSGAGKSTVLKSLEDMGYYCIDNLPPALMKQFVQMCHSMSEPIEEVAIGIDVRGRHFFDELEPQLRGLKGAYPECQVVFLEATDKILIDRFKETRRTHPLNPDGTLIDGINLEREKMRDIKFLADFVLDTTHMNGRTLGLAIKQQFGEQQGSKGISLTFQSFGFKKGIPIDSDLVFDVRFLPNPYYDEVLKPMSGNDKPIIDYVFQWQETQTFFHKLRDMLDFLIPEYGREGKNQLIVSIGCTGGRHRSVALANRLAEDYQKLQYVTTIKHRDLK